MQSLREPTSDTAAETVARELVAAVPPAIWFIRAQMRAHRKGLSLPQFRVLVLVNAQPSLSLSVLAENLGSSLPTASRMVGGLVDKGLLTRNGCDQDRRQLALKITDEGRAVLRDAWANARSAVAAKLAGLTDGQRATIGEAMGHLQEIFGTLELPKVLNSEIDELTPTDAAHEPAVL